MSGDDLTLQTLLSFHGDTGKMDVVPFRHIFDTSVVYSPMRLPTADDPHYQVFDTGDEKLVYLHLHSEHVSQAHLEAKTWWSGLGRDSYRAFSYVDAPLIFNHGQSNEFSIAQPTVEDTAGLTQTRDEHARRMIHAQPAIPEMVPEKLPVAKGEALALLKLLRSIELGKPVDRNNVIPLCNFAPIYGFFGFGGNGEFESIPLNSSAWQGLAIAITDTAIRARHIAHARFAISYDVASPFMHNSWQNEF